MSLIPEGCPTCGALPCDWAAGAEVAIDALAAEREADRANINLKADFIDKSLDQLAQGDQTIAELLAVVTQYRDDLRHPIDGESRERRSQMVAALIAKVTGGAA